MTYLITFTCYGAHLHGHPAGSVDRSQNHPGIPLLHPDPSRAAHEFRRMNHPPYLLDAIRRATVLAATKDRCDANDWTLHAAHIRTNHIHLVIESETQPARIMNDLKSYASRRLNQLNLDPPETKRWSRHGSTRWLWHAPDVAAAIQYVVTEQGAPMSVFERQ